MHYHIYYHIRRVKGRFHGLLLVLGAVGGCSGADLLSSRIAANSIGGLPRTLTGDEQQLVGASNTLGFALFRQLAQHAGPDANLFISPLSVATALGMAYNGATDTTLAEMQRLLGLQGMPLDAVDRSYQSLMTLLRGLDPRVSFTLANALWYDQGFTPAPSFVATMQTSFDAKVAGLDFSNPAAATAINAWVDQATQGRIPSIVPVPLPSQAVTFLTNAIYFKGTWAQPIFDPRLTTMAPFRLRTGDTTLVPMMSGDTEGVWSLGLGTLSDGSVIIDVPYGGQAFSMTIVEPPTPGGLDSLVSRLSDTQWKVWVAALGPPRYQGYLSLPKFTLSFGDSLNVALRSLGMPDAFCGSPIVQFSNLGQGLCIGTVEHEAWLDVNEQGTEAAAATDVSFFEDADGPPHIVVDRPFLFAIRERFSGTILFLGRVTNPAAM